MAPSLSAMNTRLLLLTLVLLLISPFSIAAALPSNATLSSLHRADALRSAFASQLEVTGNVLNEILCAAALTGLPAYCEDAAAKLWSNASAANATVTTAELLQSLVAAVSNDMQTAVQYISDVAGVADGGGNVVETVRPGSKPWGTGSTSQPTYRGEMVAMKPAVHVPVYSESDAVAAAINGDVNTLGGLASKMLELYTKAAVPMMAAATTGATLYMPVPSQAPDARSQPWFQAALLPRRNIIIVVDLWSSDRTSGIARVLQVCAAAALARDLTVLQHWHVTSPCCSTGT